MVRSGLRCFCPLEVALKWPIKQDLVSCPQRICGSVSLLVATRRQRRPETRDIVKMKEDTIVLNRG